MSVQGVVENPHALLAGLSMATTVAKNLVELSIRDHRGGKQVWDEIMTKEVMPSLRRLSMYDITSYEDEYIGPLTGESGVCMLVTSMGTPLVRMCPPSECEAVSDLLGGIHLLDQLELLVSEDHDRLEEFPSLVHLTLLDSTTEILPSSKYAQVLLGDGPSEIDAIFDSLSTLLDSDESLLEYLCFPSSLLTPTSSQSEILKRLVEHQVEIVYDGDSQNSFVPPSFTAYLEKKKEEEVVEATK